MAKSAPGTSKRTTNSDARTDAPATFDLQSWRGLTEILKVARNSELEDEAYAKFRDLVLRYAQSKGDSELREKIDSTINQYSLTPRSGEEIQRLEDEDTEEDRAGEIGSNNGDEEEQSNPDTKSKQSEDAAGTFRASMRPTPQFKKPLISPQTSREATASNLVKTAEQPPNETQDKPRTSGSSENTTVTTEALEKDARQPNKVDTHTAPAPEEHMRSNPSGNSEHKSIEEHKRRIAQIKQEVNGRVGNPITLMNEGDPIGRNYMNALLAAMKATAGGMAGTLSAKMQALETAYTELIRRLEETPVKAIEPEKEEQPQPTSPREPIEKEDTKQLTQEETMPRGGEGRGTAESQDKKRVATVPESRSMEPQGKAKKQNAPEPSQTRRKSEQVQGSGMVKDDAEADDKQHEQHKGRPEASLEEHTVASSTASKPEQQTRSKKRIENAAAFLKSQDNAPSKKQDNTATRTPIPEEIFEENKEMKKSALNRVQRTETTGEFPEEVSKKKFKESSVPKQQNYRGSKVDEKRKNTKRESASEVKDEPQKQRASAEKDSTKVHVGMTENLAVGFDQGVSPEQARATAGARHSKQTEIKNISDMVDRVTEAQSQLSSADITNGLSELLEEWSLFKGSGLLGMGPGGMEHPLYKQLSVLRMSEVMSGRWEGATQDNLRILKDYVNAWRNEQGVTYNRGETFEHYLRRVVQRVLKRQKVNT